MGITQKYTKTYRLSLIREKKHQLVRLLSKSGFSYGEISEIIRLDKSGISRIVRFRMNKNG